MNSKSSSLAFGGQDGKSQKPKDQKMTENIKLQIQLSLFPKKGWNSP